MTRLAAAPRPLPEPYRRSSVETTALRLDGNEGALAEPALLERLTATMLREPARLLRDYPSTDRLRDLLAARFGVPPARVAVTAGADGALDRLFRAYLQAGDEVLVAQPTFEMFPRFAALAGATLRSAPWRGSFPVSDLIALAGPRARLALAVSPNNPTGEVIRRGELEQLSRALPGTLIVLDHVYVEYADCDLTLPALELPNVVVVRTFSKARGLAACRVGYTLGPETAIEAIGAAGEPYPVAALSLAVAEVNLLTCGDSTRAHVERIRSHRAALAGRLADLGVEVPESQANFVYLELPAFASELRSGLLALGFAVREFPGAVRITVPDDPEVLERLLGALDGLLQSGGRR